VKLSDINCKIDDYLFGSRLSGIIVRLWVICLLLLNAYNAYVLGWTNKLVPKNIREWNSWSARAIYAMKGFFSLPHLNLFSILMAGSLVVPPIIFLFLLVKPKQITADKKAVYLAYGYLFLMTIFTVLKIDTPKNYYASRYFLPVLVPFSVILLAVLLKMQESKLFYLPLIAAVLLFNVPYDYNLYKVDGYQKSYQTIEQLQAIIPPKSYVFLVGDKNLERFLKLPLKYMCGLKVINIYSEGKSQGEITNLMDSYGNALNMSKSYVISLSPPPYEKGTDYKVIERIRKRRPWRILYPTGFSESTRKYYVYSVRLDRNTLYRLGGWTNGDDVIVTGNRRILPGAKYLVLKTFGWRFSRVKSLGELRLRIFVNGTLCRFSHRDKNDYYVELNQGTSEINEIVVKSSTFVPALSEPPSTDTRKLGIDIDRIMVE
jgi:hypothetical protein